MSATRLLRLPPRIKVLEAAGALADGRVRVRRLPKGLAVARVSSSAGDREYLVVVRQGNGGSVLRVYSDDNGTRYRNYVGYPIIAVLMELGLLPRDPEVEEALKGVRWRELNEKYKKYSVVEGLVAAEAERRGVGRDRLEGLVRSVLSALRGYRVIYDPGLAEKARSLGSP